MSIRKVKEYTIRDKRKIRIRKKILGTTEKPRLSVYRSLNHMYAQLIDDSTGVSIATVSSKSKALLDAIKGAENKVAQALIIGKEIAKVAQEKNISTVVFDRNGYLYHGRVKAVADGAREGGLKF
ncbi:MAG: 50S ribosomal protein L18 [Ignavibacteria bacterium]|nr:MAG: 50S ribosomal protein L18 [Ignavibacteria bacterium]